MPLSVTIFFNGSSSLAGTELYLIHLAEALLDAGHRIVLLDNAQSALTAHFQGNSQVQWVEYEDSGPLVLPPGQNCVLVPVYDLSRLRRLVGADSVKVLAVELDNGYWRDPIHTPWIRRLFSWMFRANRQFLLNTRGMAFIEPYSIALAESLGYRHAEQGTLLPIIVDIPSESRVRSGPHSPMTRLHFMSVGRTTPGKIVPAAYFFAEIRTRLPDARFTFVTHNPEMGEKLFSELGAPWVRCLPGGGLDVVLDYLRSADCCLAMGTVSLNAASIGLPTLVTDSFSKLPAPGGRLRGWVETSGGCLGAAVDQPSAGEGLSVDEALRALAEDYAAHSANALAYVRRHHSPARIAETFETAVATSRLTVRHYRCHPSTVAMRVWGMVFMFISRFCRRVK